jgi:hypothetical protein
MSCPAAGECVAVGFNRDAEKGKGGPLAEVWNGKAWRHADRRAQVNTFFTAPPR